jgi:hypothetical protein
MIIKHHVFAHYSTKTHLFFGQVRDIFFVTIFQNCGSEHDHGLLWMKDAPIHGINTNEKIFFFVNKYISCNVSLLPITLQNAQQHQHTWTYKKKSHVICRFHYPLLPVNEKEKENHFN